MDKYILAFIYLVLHTQVAHAYLDPGTGSMLLAVTVSILSTLFFLIKTMWYRIITLFNPNVRKYHQETKNSDFNVIVCYSEGGQYWNTFRPTIQALESQKRHVSYLSSDPNDLGLQYQSPYVFCKYIGQGNKAYTYLNLLHAKICILTTPNLGTLQIRRSKNVEHYAYISHSPIDIHLYKLFAFDFFDSIFVSGPYQEKSLRHLEQLRNTKEKICYPIGCPYFDTLLSKKLAQSEPPKSSNNLRPTILLAPTWGKKSELLSVAGETILQELTQHYKVIVRPHPQSYIVEKEMIEYLQQKFDGDNVVWDRNPDNFESMNSADVLISEQSGIIFDFAFIFEKPILTYMRNQIDVEGMDGNDIPWNPWELDILSDMGQTFTNSQISDITSLVTQTLKNQSFYINNIKSLRNTQLYNFGNTQSQILQALDDILIN